MYESDELKKKMIERMKQENNKLIQITKEIQTKKTKEMKQIEKWTSMNTKDVIFDSNCCEWSSFKSTFDTRIFGKQKLLILIKIQDLLTIGGFV